METLFIELLVNQCGLPEDFAKAKLQSLIAEAGLAGSDLDLGLVRELAANLLQDVVLETLEK